MTDKKDRKQRKGAKPPESLASRAKTVASGLVVCALLGVGIGSFVCSGSGGNAPAAEEIPPITAPWIEVTSPEFGFRVEMPPSAHHGSETTQVLSFWMARYQTGVVQLAVWDCAGRLCIDNPKLVLDGIVATTLATIQGTELQERSLEVPCPEGTCRSLEFEATVQEGIKFSSRVIISRDKVYQLNVGDLHDPTNAFNKFVDSFQFTGTKEPGLGSAQPASAASAPTRPAPSAAWIELKSPELRFRVEMPSPVEPLEKSDESVGWMGKVEDAVAQVTVTKCPLACSETPFLFFDMTRETAASILHGTSSNEKHLEIPCPTGTCLGLEYEIKDVLGMHFYSRMFIFDHKFYQLRVNEMVKPNSRGNFDKLVTSFAFL